MRPEKSAGSPASPHGTSKRYARCKFESSSLMFLDGYCLSVVAKLSCFHLPILGNLFPHVSHFQASFPLSPITPSSCTQTDQRFHKPSMDLASFTKSVSWCSSIGSAATSGDTSGWALLEWAKPSILVDQKARDGRRNWKSLGSWRAAWEKNRGYPLVNVYITIWKDPAF